MLIPLTVEDLSQLSSQEIDSNIEVRGYAYLRDQQVVCALPVTKIETRGWGCDGFVGEDLEPSIKNQLIKKVLEDLQSIEARILISFTKLAQLKKSGVLYMLERKGLVGDLAPELLSVQDDNDLADLVKACQQDSEDFKEIPANDDALDPYRGYGPSLWRRWQKAGVLLVNEISDNTNHLAFVGLKIEQRGQGLGKKMVKEALIQAGPNKILTTAVDTRNKAACKIYKTLGFKITEEKEIYFKSFD